ncbi:MAG: hypothetical protein VB997_01650 [Opitutales bacterium]
MQKSSRIVNWLTIITSLAAFVVVLLLWLRGDEASKKLSELNQEFAQLEKAAADQNKSQAANLARAKRKNQEILKEISSIKQDTASKDRSIGTAEANLQAKLDQVAKAREDNHKTNLAIEALKKEIQHAQEDINRLEVANPTTGNELDGLRDLIKDEHRRGEGIQDQLSDYADETSTLNHHYKSILVALEKDLTERPWIERGETLTTRIQNLNLDAGVLMLPIGRNDGLEDEMRFLVTGNGRHLCRILVKEAGLSHSIAMIIPMFGRVGRLRENQNIEITNL